MQNLSQKKIDDLRFSIMSNCVNSRIAKFKAGEYITSFGLRKKTLGVIVKGKADIVRNNVDGDIIVTKKLGPGSIFSDAFSCFSLDSIYVLSKTDTEILFIEYPQIFKNCPINCPRHSGMISEILNLLTENFVTLNEKINILSCRTIRGRFLTFCTLYIEDNEEKSLVLPYSISEIADFLCVDRSALMRELKKMKDEKIIKRNNRSITILDYENINKYLI